MQHLEVSGAVRHIYISLYILYYIYYIIYIIYYIYYIIYIIYIILYILYIYVIRRLKVKKSVRDKHRELVVYFKFNGMFELIHSYVMWQWHSYGRDSYRLICIYMLSHCYSLDCRDPAIPLINKNSIPSSTSFLTTPVAPCPPVPEPPIAPLCGMWSCTSVPHACVGAIDPLKSMRPPN